MEEERHSSCLDWRPLRSLYKTLRRSGMNVSRRSGDGSSERHRSRTTRSSAGIEWRSLRAKVVTKNRNEVKENCAIYLKSIE